MHREYAEDFSIPLIGRLATTFGLSANHTQLHNFLGHLFGRVRAVSGTDPDSGASSNSLRNCSGATGEPACYTCDRCFDRFPALFLLLLAVLLALGAWVAAGHLADSLTLRAGAVGAAALLIPEMVLIRDHLEGKMNRLSTIFKFYYQVWLIWGGIAAYALW